MAIWKIKDKKEGVFTIKQPQRFGDLYFPLTNTKGRIFSWVSPYLSGDIKTSVHNYLNYPATIFDIKNPLCIRTLWLYFNKGDVLNLSCFWPTEDEIMLEAGPLWHKLIRKNKSHKLTVEVTNFIPEGFSLEIMWIKITNTGSNPCEFMPTTSIPLFCRSQENFIDHRHVTSLLNRAFIKPYGIEVSATMHFDERGHKKNKSTYFAYGFTDKEPHLSGVFSELDEFCGEKGNLVFPESIHLNKTPKKAEYIEGEENFAGLKFKKHKLPPSETLNIFLIMGSTNTGHTKDIYKKLNTSHKVYAAFEESKKSWAKIFNSLHIESGNTTLDFWIKWVNMQPTFRKLFGNSYLAHFDYGKGGRGWRDLWQDLLSLNLMSSKETRNTIINNFRGVRIDGSNATIITNEADFISDRNKISRVWMDHGVWPYLTLKSYIDRAADYRILLEKVEFFRDHLLRRAKEIDYSFLKDNRGNFKLKDKNNKVYKSTVLDHLLIQNIVQFFNVGAKGNTKLENADWNDALDMAPAKGESVAFSCMYAHNLKGLAQLLQELRINNICQRVEITEEVKILLDTLSAKINYDSVKEKREILKKYFQATRFNVEGKKIKITINDLIKDLNRKADWMIAHIRNKEWLRNMGFFNGYYDNNSRRVEGKISNITRMMLTSQVFPIMSGVAQKNHIKKIWKACLRYLKAKKVCAFRLNTDFGEIKLDLGRAFGFSYGDKENGSIFSHMNVMLAYSLYAQGFIKEGYSIVESLFRLATSKQAGIAPCMPEYFNLDHKGLYCYLTGSASWLIYLLTTQVLGIKFNMGNLVIEPKLLKEQFLESNSVKIGLDFQGRKLDILYLNPHKKNWPNYKIKQVKANGEKIKIGKAGRKIEFGTQQIERILSLPANILEIVLD